MANSLPAWMQQLASAPAGTSVSDGQGGYYAKVGGGITSNPITGESYGDPGYYFTHLVGGDGNAAGTPYSVYDQSGNLQGNYTTSADKSGFGDFAKNLALVAGAVYGAGALGAGGAGAGAGGAADGGIYSMGMDGLPSYESLAAGDSAALSGVGAGGAGSGALGTLGGIPQVTIPAASTFPEVSTLGGAAAGTGGVLGTIASKLGIDPSLLSLGATALGAIAGSKGVKQNQTSTSSINPQVAPYVYGDGTNGGLLSGVQGLLQQQTSPQYQQRAQQVQNVAQGLLSGPVAGNGFSRFFPNR